MKKKRRSRINIEKLTVAHLFKKIPNSYSIRSVVALFKVLYPTVNQNFNPVHQKRALKNSDKYILFRQIQQYFSKELGVLIRTAGHNYICV